MDTTSITLCMAFTDLQIKYASLTRMSEEPGHVFHHTQWKHHNRRCHTWQELGADTTIDGVSTLRPVRACHEVCIKWARWPSDALFYNSAFLNLTVEATGGHGRLLLLQSSGPPAVWYVMYQIAELQKCMSGAKESVTLSCVWICARNSCFDWSDKGNWVSEAVVIRWRRQARALVQWLQLHIKHHPCVCGRVWESTRARLLSQKEKSKCVTQVIQASRDGGGGLAHDW